MDARSGAEVSEADTEALCKGSHFLLSVEIAIIQEISLVEELVVFAFHFSVLLFPTVHPDKLLPVLLVIEPVPEGNICITEVHIVAVRIVLTLGDEVVAKENLAELLPRLGLTFEASVDVFLEVNPCLLPQVFKGHVIKMGGDNDLGDFPLVRSAVSTEEDCFLHN